MPYAEPLTLLLLAAALLLVIRRQYLLGDAGGGADVPVPAGGCAVRSDGGAAVPLPHGGSAVRVRRTRVTATARAGLGRPLPALTAVSGIAALIWPASAWAATGDIQAYTKTETVWRGHDLVPFKPWFDTGIQLFGPVLGVLAPFVFVAFSPLMLFSAPVVRLGVELRLWCACYMAYLLLFLHPQTSTFRMLLPLFPLALALRWFPGPGPTGGRSSSCSCCCRSSGSSGCGPGRSCRAAGIIRPESLRLPVHGTAEYDAAVNVHRLATGG